MFNVILKQAGSAALTGAKIFGQSALSGAAFVGGVYTATYIVEKMLGGEAKQVKRKSTQALKGKVKRTAKKAESKVVATAAKPKKAESKAERPQRRRAAA